MRLADLHFSSRDGYVVAVVAGEIDMSNAEALARALTERPRTTRTASCST
jgi:hypothetical protein